MPKPTGETAPRKSADEKKWWQQDPKPEDMPPRSSRGQACPKCTLADLDYDTLFRLRCPICGYVAECGAFT